MSNQDREAPATEPEPAALPSERDRELLDYLIERAWQELVRRLETASAPANDNEPKKRAA